ncbi:MAG: GNAT family N-acetyltransferase [Ignavibacteria bacterium]|nr:GNAT family N-acetyltransferase [Ignavibacteria bacterium]
MDKKTTNTESVNKKEIFDLLYKDRIQNLNMINFIKSYDVELFLKSGDSALVRGTSDKPWIYISSKSESEFRELIGQLSENDRYLAAIEEWMIPILKEKYKVLWNLKCKRYLLPKHTQPGSVHHIVRYLKPGDARYIHENSMYRKLTQIEYITDRIKRGIGLGLYDKGGMVAWILTHDDGAIGFLNVLPEFRRRGYGTDITNAVIKKVRERGGIPFVHIEEDNINSVNLAKKVGFAPDKYVNWLRIENLTN